MTDETVSCANCRHKNPLANRHCGQCGAPLDDRLDAILTFLGGELKSRIDEALQEKSVHDEFVELKATNAVVDRVWVYAKRAGIVVAGAIAIVAAVLGFFGIKTISDMQKFSETATLKAKQATEAAKAVEIGAADAQKLLDQAQKKVMDLTTRINEVEAQLGPTAERVAGLPGIRRQIANLDTRVEAQDLVTRAAATKKPEETIELLTQAIRLNPKYVTAFNHRGSAYNEKGEYDRAIADLDEAIRLNPKVFTAFNNRGFAYMKKGEYDRAIADLDEAIRLNPKYATAFNNRGFSYNEKGEYDRAIADFDEAVRLNLKDGTAFNHRGSAYINKGEYDRAIADLDEAVRLDPKDGTAFNNRGFAYVKKGEYDRAIVDLDEAVRLDPKDGTAFNNRGSAYIGKGEYDRAIADLDEAVRLDPKDGTAFNNRGYAYNKKGEYDRAIADLDEAIRLNPKKPSPYRHRCWARALSGKPLDVALADCDKASSLKPKYAHALDSRALVHFIRGELDLAREDLTQAREWEPKRATPDERIEEFRKLVARTKSR